MLPSFRLIMATFCCGFIMVFAGLRLATSINGIHQAMPVMAAHAAPVMVGAIGDQDLRRSPATVPVMYDLRFAVSATPTTPAPAAPSPAIGRTTPLMMPLVILPPIAREAATSEPLETAETTVAATLATAPALEPAPATLDIPLPEPAAIDLTFSSPVQTKDQAKDQAKETHSIAAVVPTPVPAQPSPPIDIPLPEPASVDLTFSPPLTKSEAEDGPKSEAMPAKRPETDARAGSANESDARPLMIAALPTENPVDTVRLPIKGIPLPKPRGVERTAALHPHAVYARTTRTAAAKAKPRRRATAQRNDFDNFFAFPSGRPQ